MRLHGIARLATTFAGHAAVNHTDKEYVRYEPAHKVTTNTVEGYFSIFKRGMKGIYQHCSEKHLHRYLAEFDFRYNHRVALGYDDGERAVLAMKGIEGKRLTYRPNSLLTEARSAPSRTKQEQCWPNKNGGAVGAPPSIGLAPKGNPISAP